MAKDFLEIWNPDTQQGEFISDTIPVPSKTTNNSVITSASKNLNFSVTTSGVEIKASTSPLANRHTIIVINDSSTMISLSLGINDTFGNSSKLFSGQAVQISFSPDQYIPIYARIPYFATTVGIIEVAGGF